MHLSPLVQVVLRAYPDLSDKPLFWKRKASVLKVWRGVGRSFGREGGGKGWYSKVTAILRPEPFASLIYGTRNILSRCKIPTLPPPTHTHTPHTLHTGAPAPDCLHGAGAGVGPRQPPARPQVCAAEDSRAAGGDAQNCCCPAPGTSWIRVAGGCERCGVWKVWGVWGRRLLLPCPGPLIATDGMCRMKERIKCDWSVGAWGWRSRCTQAKRGQVEVVLTTRKNRPPRPP